MIMGTQTDNQLKHPVTSNLPQSLIDRCIALSEEHNKPHFIFDYATTGTILKKSKSDSEVRNNTIEMLDTDSVDGYYIDDGSFFEIMPSRRAQWDSETRSENQYERYKCVIDFIRSLGFEPSENNLGSDYEQSFIINFQGDDIGHQYTIRQQPNFFIKIFSYNYRNDALIKEIYNGFFSRSGILNALKQDSPSLYTLIIRDTILEEILK